MFQKAKESPWYSPYSPWVRDLTTERKRGRMTLTRQNGVMISFNYWPPKLQARNFADSKSQGVRRWAPAATRFIACAPSFPEACWWAKYHEPKIQLLGTTNKLRLRKWCIFSENSGFVVGAKLWILKIHEELASLTHCQQAPATSPSFPSTVHYKFIIIGNHSSVH